MKYLHGIGGLLLGGILSLSAPSVFALGEGYWHTSGNQILDINNQVVRIAGVNWYGFETTSYLPHGLWAQDYQVVLNTIKSRGYNFIRIPFSNQMVESNPVPTNFTQSANNQVANTALVGQTALQDLDTIVSYAGSIGLRVILDNHRSDAGDSNQPNGLWYTSAYPSANWVADWKTMAIRYSASRFTFNGNPTVIGMDLRNEPHSIDQSGGRGGGCWTGDSSTNGCPRSNTAQNWPVAAETAGNAILAINSNLLIFVEGTDCYSGDCDWQGGNLQGVASNPVNLSVANRIVYSPHDYGPNLFQQPWFNSGTSQASLSTTFKKYWGYISVNGTAPVWLGEFGTTNVSSDIQSGTAGSQGQWFQSLVSYLSSNAAVSWTYWALNGEDSYGLLNNNYDATPASALKQSLLASIQSPLSGGGGTPSFTVATAASSLSVVRGNSSTDSITVGPLGGFTGNVTLAISGLPSGVTAVFGTNPTRGGSVLTLNASTSAATGTSTLTIVGTSGTSGTLSASTTVSLTVSAAQTPTFTLGVSPSSATVTMGGSTTDTLQVKGAGGFSGNVTLAATGLPSGVTASFSANPTAGTSVVTFTAGSAATAATSTITIKGTSGALTASTPLSLTVKAATTGGPACHVGYAVSNQWSGGFSGNLSIANTGTTALSNWTLTWTFANGQTVTQLWNGNLAQSGNQVTVSNLSYNGSIPAGSTYTGVGFNGSWNNAINAVPTSFVLNGTVCK
jgi:endoglucanase